MVNSILWKVKVPTKVKCFIQLTLKQKIITWDALQLRGFHGPSRCSFCLTALETAEHLFAVCSFLQNLQLFMCSGLNCQWTWVDGSIADFLQQTAKHSHIPLALPLVFIWEYWRARNCFIIQQIPVDASHIVQKVHSYYVADSGPWVRAQSISYHAPRCVSRAGFFDGAEKNGSCGARMVIQLEENHTFLLRMDVGKGTNTRAKLLALWGLLYFSRYHEISMSLVLGDSKVIVDWALDSHTILSVSLFHWLRRVRRLMVYSPSLSFSDIYRSSTLRLMHRQSRLLVWGQVQSHGRSYLMV